MVDQSIFQQSAMIITQEFSSASNFFYQRCRLFIFSWFLLQVLLHNISFSFGLQTIFYFSSQSIMQTLHGIIISPYLTLRSPYTLKNLHCVHNGFYRARASGRLLEWATEVMKEKFYQCFAFTRSTHGPVDNMDLMYIHQQLIETYSYNSAFSSFRTVWAEAFECKWVSHCLYINLNQDNVTFDL